MTESQTTPTEDAGALTWIGGSNAPAPESQPEPPTTWADAACSWADTVAEFAPWLGIAVIMAVYFWGASL
ncbi:hypothetical protein ACFCZ3_19770 [Cellulosimicrobium cellulans]|uniref:hypothetical protein n=1 Tax=Cellulosimicrobium cellulans TaxID=1710 RepID=UPI0035DA8EAD